MGDALPIETVAAQPSRAEAATEIPVDMVHGPGGVPVVLLGGFEQTLAGRSFGQEILIFIV